MTLINFYCSCIKIAFSSGVKRLEFGFSIIAISIGAADYFLTFPQFLKDELQKFLAPAFVVLLMVVIFLRLVRAPFQLFESERLAKEASEKARLPSLEVSLPTPPVVNSIPMRGQTHESFSGSRQTIITSREFDVVALVVKNIGENIATDCQARILSITRKLTHEDQALEVVESINLPWVKEDPEGSHRTNIPPNDSRRVWLGGVRQHGHIWLFRVISSLPMEYQQLLGTAGTFEVLLQIDGANIAPQQAKVEIIASEGPEVQNGIQRGNVSVRLLSH